MGNPDYNGIFIYQLLGKKKTTLRIFDVGLINKILVQPKSSSLSEM